MKHVGIIGYGKMGASIFKLFAARSYSVTVITETRQEALDAADGFFKKLERSFKRESISVQAFGFQKNAIRFSHCLDDLASADLVIEAVSEDFQIKSSIFNCLESHVDSHAIIVSNTSSLAIRELMKGFQYSDRFCGFHFFNPVPLVNLVEIVKTDRSNPELIEKLRSISREIGKLPIVVNDAPGSVINAILAYYFMEAIFLLEDGVMLPSEIDRVSKQFFHAGPCESLDIIGIDFFILALKNAIHAGTIYPIRQHLNNRGNDSDFQVNAIAEISLPFLFEKLLSSGRLGRKVSKGIYRYENAPIDEAMSFYLDTGKGMSLNALETAERESLVAMRLLYAIFSGSLLSLFHQMASREDLDIGVKEVLHMKKGPFSLMKDIGIAALEKNFDFLQHHAGKRFARPGSIHLESLLS